MRLVTIDSVATTKNLHANLNNLPPYAISVNGNVDLINSYFDINSTQILEGELLSRTILPSCLTLTSQYLTSTSSSTSPRSKTTTMMKTWATTSCTRI